MNVSVPTANQATPTHVTATPTARWLMPITAMMFVLGGFIGLAMKTEKLVRLQNGASSSNYAGLAEAYTALKGTADKLQDRIKQLQADNDRLSTSQGSNNAQMAQQLREAQFDAGLTRVKGPGIVVTLRDSSKRAPSNLPAGIATDLTDAYIIHDVDIQRVLNELRAGGAEALAVNDQRVVGATAVRCVGPAIQVNGIPLTPPFNIRAIGDPSTLQTTMELPGGLQEQLQAADPAMFQIQQEKSLLLPSYAGFQSRFAKPVMDSANGQ